MTLYEAVKNVCSNMIFYFRHSGLLKHIYSLPFNKEHVICNFYIASYRTARKENYEIMRNQISNMRNYANIFADLRPIALRCLSKTFRGIFSYFQNMLQNLFLSEMTGARGNLSVLIDILLQD